MKIKNQRKSYQQIGKIYFFTASIHKWKNLLDDDENKNIIVDSLRHLVKKNLIDLYAFVIMPNHIHLLWKNKKKNKTEMPWVSFLKYTAHIFLRRLKEQKSEHDYAVIATNKQHEIWRKDSHAIEIYTRKSMIEKLGHIHMNPAECKRITPEFYGKYRYSSARYYEKGIDEFDMLSDIYKEFQLLRVSTREPGAETTTSINKALILNGVQHNKNRREKQID